MKQYDLASLKPILAMLVTAMITVMIFLALYRYNNKYTVENIPAINGILDLSDREDGSESVYSIVEGWEYYPGVLLTPADFKAEQPIPEPSYITIGNFTRLSTKKHENWLLGTYRLTILLPQTDLTYALEIPEIPIAGSIYIHDHLIARRGDPAGKISGMGSEVFFLTGGGRFEILIQAADLVALHQKMLAPPILGLSWEIIKIRNISFLIRTFFMVVAVCAAILSLNLAINIRWWRGYLFFFLCLSFLGFVLCPLARIFIPLGVQPWYGIQTFSFHTMLWLVIILENDLYRIRGGRISALFGTFCVLFLLYGCYIQYVPVTIAVVMHYLMEWYKYAVAFYLVMVANTALVEHMEHGLSLLIMAVIFTTTLFMERVLPFYEPMVGSAFIVVGCCALMAGMLRIFWSDMADAFSSRMTFIYETSRMNRLLLAQREHYRQINVKIEETRRIRHDMRHHIRMLQTLAAQETVEELKKYLEQLIPAVQPQEAVRYTGNYALDALLSHYIARSKADGIQTKVEVQLPGELMIPDDELCVLFGNLLENAVEACKRQQNGKQFLELRARQDDTHLSIVLDNSYEGQIRYYESYFFSSKREGVGVGVESVRTIVQKYGGIADFAPEKGIFRVSIMIPV